MQRATVTITLPLEWNARFHWALPILDEGVLVGADGCGGCQMSPDVFLSRRLDQCRLLSLKSGEYVSVEPVGPAIILLRCKSIFHLRKLVEKGGEK